MIRVQSVRARIYRAIFSSAILASSLALAGCNTDDVYQVPARAMKQLSPQMLALLDKKNMPKESPILVRIFKEESELELWKQDTTGRFELLKVYPICKWSGELGPKVREGDRQAPEGFYAITPALMNPNSNYYLAINIGFPNVYDKANGRTGAFLMIHGDCSSRGCYAMTDEEIGEIYSLAREAFLGGQQSFQIQAYPFHMTAANLARHRNNPNMAFWKMIKLGNDHFEVTHQEPKVDVCDRRYVFDAEAPANSTKPLVFNPTGRCPDFAVAQEIAGPALEKERRDEFQTAQLDKFMPIAPVKTGTDGGTNKVFIAQIEHSTRTVDSQGHLHVVLPPAPNPPSGDATFASRLFGGLFAANSYARPTQVASSDSATQARSGTGGFFGNLFSPNRNVAAAAGSAHASPSTTGTTAAQKPKPVTERQFATTGSRPKPKAEPNKIESNKLEADASRHGKARQEANAAIPVANYDSLLSGAQPVVPAGTFDSRWGALQ